MKKLMIFAVSLFVCCSSAYAVQAAEKDNIPDFLKEFIAEYFRGQCQLPPEIILPEKPLPEEEPAPETPLPEETPLPDEKPGTENDSNENQGSSDSENVSPSLTIEEEIHRLINIERANHGLAPLQLSSELSRVAESHSQDMASKDYFSHTSPEGLSPFDRIKGAGISYGAAAENIAAGQKTAESVVKAWMNSDGHRKNILNANYKKTGIGVVNGGSYGIYHTQLFTD